MTERESRTKYRNPGERMSDQDWPHRVRMFFFGEKRFYRDVWLIIVTFLVLLALLSFKNTQDDQIQGRRNATDTICAFNQAFLKAGQGVIEASAVQAGSEFEKNLIKLGYPTAEEREKSSQTASEAYADFISKSVEKDTGVNGIINDDGNVDCDKLAQIAKVAVPDKDKDK